MLDAFISYSRRDSAVAEQTVTGLVSRGFVVWWDHQLEEGQVFPSVLRDMIERSRIVIVLWSEASVASAYVQAEAMIARERKNYFGVRLGPSAKLNPPFNALHLPTWPNEPSAIEDHISSVADEIERRRETSGATASDLSRDAEDARRWVHALHRNSPEAIDAYRASGGQVFAKSARDLAGLGSGGSLFGSSLGKKAAIGIGGFALGAVLTRVASAPHGGGAPDSSNETTEDLVADDGHGDECDDELHDDDREDDHLHDDDHRLDDEFDDQ